MTPYNKLYCTLCNFVASRFCQSMSFRFPVLLHFTPCPSVSIVNLISRIQTTRRLNFPVFFNVQSHKNFMPYSCSFISIQIFDDTNTSSLDQHDCLENNDLITYKKTTVGTPHLYDSIDRRSLIGVVETPGDCFVRQWITR